MNKGKQFFCVLMFVYELLNYLHVYIHIPQHTRIHTYIHTYIQAQIFIDALHFKACYLVWIFTRLFRGDKRDIINGPVAAGSVWDSM